MKEDIKQLQQTKHPNAYPTPPGNYRSLRTTDGLVVCRRCHQVRHFARACLANLPPPRVPTHYQNHWHNYVPPATSRHPHSSYAPNPPVSPAPPSPPPNQYSQHPSYRPHANLHNTMGYPYPQDAVHTNPWRRPTFQSTDHADKRYQARRSNIPGQHNNYNNMIQNHALMDCQCLVSGSLDNIPNTTLIDTGSSINLLDKHLYYLLSSILPLQPIQFSVSGADDRPIIALGTVTLSIAINNNIFRLQLVVTRNILFPVVLGIDFLQTHDGITSFPNT